MELCDCNLQFVRYLWPPDMFMLRNTNWFFSFFFILFHLREKNQQITNIGYVIVMIAVGVIASHRIASQFRVRFQVILIDAPSFVKTFISLLQMHIAYCMHTYIVPEPKTQVEFSSFFSFLKILI